MKERIQKKMRAEGINEMNVMQANYRVRDIGTNEISYHETLEEAINAKLLIAGMQGRSHIDVNVNGEWEQSRVNDEISQAVERALWHSQIRHVPGQLQKAYLKRWRAIGSPKVNDYSSVWE
jgi:ribosomal protein S9